MTIVFNRTTPENLREHFFAYYANDVDIRSFFTVTEVPVKEKFIRKYAPPVVAHLPKVVQQFSTSVFKRLRNPSLKLDLQYPLDFEENKRVVGRIQELNLFPWKGKKAVVCLTHDVDHQDCWDFLGELAMINAALKVPATVNVLTQDRYLLDIQLLKQMKANGFEIGLHGATHDQGLALRDEAVIKKQLQSGLTALQDFNVKGFRSPALSVSERLFQQLSACGIKYDSSLQIASPFYHSVKVPFPMYLEDFGIWEIPLMVQDDNYFRDTHVPYDEILASIQHFAEDVIALNGCFVLNFHPYMISRHLAFYQKLLKCLKNYDDLAFMTMRDVIRLCKGEGA